MGCNASKAVISASHIDDSVHVLLEHDKKAAQKRGEVQRGYRPREAHPLLSKIQAQEEDDAEVGTVEDSLNNAEENPEKEAELLLWHAKNHCDTIDPRDVAVAVPHRRH